MCSLLLLAVMGGILLLLGVVSLLFLHPDSYGLMIGGVSMETPLDKSVWLIAMAAMTAGAAFGYAYLRKCNPHW